MKKILTLCLACRNNQILLGLKKRGFGQNRFNGFGGKLHDGESIEEAAIREMQEEAGVVVSKLEKRGILEFEFEGEKEILEVHIFSVLSFNGVPCETEEMKPQWFDQKNIPLDKMWPDDKYWLPLFLMEKKFRGKFYFKDTDNLANHHLEEVNFL